MNETVRKKHVREPPSVPFIWEAKPGIPKKDWKPQVSSFAQLPKTPPLKLIASVPFVWEEKPGKPLLNFPHVSVPPKPDSNSILIHVASSSQYSAASNYAYGDKDKDKDSSGDNNVYQHGSYSDDDESESMTSLDLEAFSFDTDESFNSSVPSLLANCIVSSAKVSTAIPLQKNSLLSKHECYQLYNIAPSSPASSSETESSTSSYVTGRYSSPTGSAILECLFPLYPPKSGFLQRDDEPSEKVSSSPLEELKANKGLDHEEYTCDTLRRPAPTLGELIMMSRRRSYARKTAQRNIWDPPKKYTRKQAFGCFSVVSSNMIEGLLKRKYCPN